MESGAGYGDLVRFHLEGLADQLSDGGLVALAGGLEADGGGDVSVDVDLEADTLAHVAAADHAGVVKEVEYAARAGAGLDATGHTHAKQLAPLQSLGLQFLDAGVTRHLQGLCEDSGVAAAVVGGAGGYFVGELVGLDEVSQAHLGTVNVQSLGHQVHGPLDSVVGGGLAEAVVGSLVGLAGQDRGGGVTDGGNGVGADQGGNGLADLHGASTGVGAGVVDDRQVQPLNLAVIVAGHTDFPDAVWAVGVAGCHVLQAVLDKLDGAADSTAGQAGEENLLAAALVAVAAADVHVHVDPDPIGGYAHGAGYLFVDLGVLLGGPDVHHAADFVPGGNAAEGLHGDSGMAVPAEAAFEDVGGVPEGSVNFAEVERGLEGDVGAVLLVEDGGVGSHGLLGVDEGPQGFVFHPYQVGGVLGEVTAGGDHRSHPFTGEAGLAYREGVPDHAGKVHVLGYGLHPLGKLFADDDLDYAGGPLGLGGVDALDDRVGVGRGNCGHVEHAGQNDVIDKASLAQHESGVFDGWKALADPLEIGGGHPCSPREGECGPVLYGASG